MKKNFLNVGIAENNMFLIATGISEITKKKVFVYSISSFLTLRTLEIIRNYLSIEKRNIFLIGVGSGVSYSKMGKTHYNLDDINIIYSLKNILIVNPANLTELKFLYNKFKKSKKTIYFRINKNFYENKFQLLKKINLYHKKGPSSNLITSGSILNEVLDCFSVSEIKKLNIISLPIMNHDYNKNLYKLINKNKKTLLITDNSKTLFFEEIKNMIIDKNKRVHNYDFDHNKIIKVGGYQNLLQQMGLKTKNLKNFLF